MILTPGAATLTQLEAVWRGRAAVLDPAAYPAIKAAHARVMQAAAGDEPVYGINTGFGKLASMKIAEEDTADLQRNLVRSHACGVGKPLEVDTTRLMMALKLLSLGRGASGVAQETVRLIEAMLARGVTPVIPDQGSVGASGDLAPLAHMALAMMGEGEAACEGAVLPAGTALARAGLSPVTFGPKEGLALINGTQFSTACALVGLFAAWANLRAAITVSSLSTDAIMGSTAPLLAEIHALRGQPGQIEVAAAMRAAKATARAMPACRTPIASAASRRSRARRSTCCGWRRARCASRPTRSPTTRLCCLARGASCRAGISMPNLWRLPPI